MDAGEIRNLQEAYMEVYNEGLGGAKDASDEERLKNRLRDIETSTNASLDSIRNRTDRVSQRKKANQAQEFLRKHPRKKRTQTEQVDIYDIILSHLLDEGYAETPESAEAIMVSMSDEWVDVILEANRGDQNTRKSDINVEFELWVNELINEGYDLSEHTLDDMYKLYEASGGVIGGRFFRKNKSSNPGQKKSKRIADAIGNAIDRVMGYDIQPYRGPVDIPPEVRERYMRNRKRR